MYIFHKLLLLVFFHKLKLLKLEKFNNQNLQSNKNIITNNWYK